MASDEVLMNTGVPRATGRVARLIELLEAADSEVADEDESLGPD
jgi:hypothetical protein